MSREEASQGTVNGTALVLTYDEELDTGSVPAATAYTVAVGGSNVALASTSPVAVSGTTVTLTLAAAVASTDTVTLTYRVPATNPVQDEAGKTVTVSGTVTSSDRDWRATPRCPAAPFKDKPRGSRHCRLTIPLGCEGFVFRQRQSHKQQFRRRQRRGAPENLHMAACFRTTPTAGCAPAGEPYGIVLFVECYNFCCSTKVPDAHEPVKALPPLDCLRFFDAAARHESFARAGAELGVTAAAVAHRVRMLEKHVRAPLFVRRARSVRLNSRGRTFAAEIRRILLDIHDTSKRVGDHRRFRGR